MIVVTDAVLEVQIKVVGGGGPFLYNPMCFAAE